MQNRNQIFGNVHNTYSNNTLINLKLNLLLVSAWLFHLVSSFEHYERTCPQSFVGNIGYIVIEKHFLDLIVRQHRMTYLHLICIHQHHQIWVLWRCNKISSVKCDCFDNKVLWYLLWNSWISVILVFTYNLDPCLIFWTLRGYLSNNNIIFTCKNQWYNQLKQISKK